MRHMINEYTQMGVHQDLYPSSETSACLLMLEREISFQIKLFYMFSI